MLFVDQLVERCGDRAKATAKMPGKGICFDRGMVFPEFFIEVVAQAMAMANGYDALCAGTGMNDGMLVGIDSFSFHRTTLSGTLLRIEIEKLFEFGPVKIIHGEVFDGDLLLAAGDIKVWEDLG
jgi:predicted hotdog family 3-hydroxylacyl-ACP dehydratase